MAYASLSSCLAIGHSNQEGEANLLERQRSRRGIPEVVEADLYSIDLQIAAPAVPCIAAWIVAARVAEVGEVEIQIFGLDRPAWADLPFQTAADVPAGERVVVVIAAVPVPNATPHVKAF